MPVQQQLDVSQRHGQANHSICSNWSSEIVPAAWAPTPSNTVSRSMAVPSDSLPAH
jgi:hypothetical protein